MKPSLYKNKIVGKFSPWTYIGIALVFGLCFTGFSSAFFSVLAENIIHPKLFWHFVIVFIFIMGMFIALNLWSFYLLRERRYNRHCEDVMAYINVLDKAICVLDGNDNLVFSNKLYQTLWGEKATDNIFELLGREDKFAQALYRLKLKVKESQAHAEEFLLPAHCPLLNNLTKNSAPYERWISICAKTSPFADKLIIWEIEDITQQRLAYQKNFHEMSNLLKEIEDSPASFFMLDLQKKLCLTSENFRKQIGITIEDYEQKNLFLKDILPHKSFIALNKILDELALGQQGDLRLNLKTSKNQLVLCDLYFQKTLSQTEGEMIRFVVIARPQDQLVESQTQALPNIEYQQILDNLPSPFALINNEGRLLYSNGRFAQLLEEEEAFYNKNQALSLDDVIASETDKKIQNILKNISDNYQDIDAFEGFLVKKPEKQIGLKFSLISGPKDLSNHRLFFALGQEMNKQKSLEAQIEKNQKMQVIGQLAGGIAHDFNNVLTAITMSCDLLLTSHRSSDPSHPDLINIKHNANRAAALVQQLLAFSRRQTMRPEIVDLAELLSDLRIMISRLIGSKIQLHISHMGPLQTIYADPSSLQRVIINLAINARDAMLNGGKLSIVTENITYDQIKIFDNRALEDVPYILLKISDTGTGIDPKIKDKIFEPFFTTKDVGKGTGLGLATVYGIIKQMGGLIICESELGQGTSFYIYLPAYLQDIEANFVIKDRKETLNQSEAEKIIDLTGNATLLIVEDEDAVRLGNIRALKSRGYKVLAAASGAQALEIIKKEEGKIDLVISDVVMPEMDGPSLLREVKEIYPDLMFVFVSGYAEESFAKNLPENAKFGFLAKPFSLKSLASKVKETLAQKPS